MKNNVWVLAGLLSLVFSAPGARAFEGDTAVKEMAKAIEKSGQATLLVEETSDGQLGDVILAAGRVESDGSAPKQDDYTLGDEPVLVPQPGQASSNDSIFQLATSIYGGIYTLFVAAGGQVGLSIANTLEVGIDAGGIGSFAAGLYVGPYVKLAPVPYKAGKRIYLQGRAYHAILFGPEGGSATLNVAEVGVGYRHLTEKAMREGMFWSLEGGMMMDIFCESGVRNCKVGDDWAIPTLRFGMNFR